MPEALILDPSPLQIALALLAASVLGAFLPLFRRWSERGLHLFVALAAGVFLGTIFLHLLPHLTGGVEHDGHLHASVGGAASGHPLSPWIAALAGLLLLFAVEKVWLPSFTKSNATNPHTVLWSATYVGLSMHALTAGFAFSAVLDQPEVLVTLLVHKATETFSLATVMRLAGLATGRSIALLALFACIEPLGLLMGRGIIESVPALDSILTGFASGTFLYVAICDLLPEVFHGRERPRLKLSMVVLGIALTALTLERLEVLGTFAAQAARASLDVFVEMAPFLVFGFLAAGVLHVVLKREWLAKRLAGDDLKSVSWAALLGAPLPLCSCSVVPVAVSLRRAGASKGATSAFTISTPETGIDSIAVTWVLLGPFLTVARPIGALVSAIVSGAAVNWLVRRGWDRDALPAEVDQDARRFEPLAASSLAAAPALAVVSAASCCDHEAPSAANASSVAGVASVASAASRAHAPRQSSSHDESTVILRRPATAVEDESCCAHDPAPASTPAAGSKAPVWRRILRYAYVDMLDDLTPSLVLGLLITGAITVAMPATWTSSPVMGGFGGLLVMLVIGIPLYVCASASTPIAAALIAKGLSPGAAFVFLLAGPATNAASLVVLARHLGRRVVIVQVIALSVVAVLCGWVVNQIHAQMSVVSSAGTIVHEHDHGPGWASISVAILLASLMLVSLVRTHGSRDLLGPLREDAPEPAR